MEEHAHLPQLLGQVVECTGDRINDKLQPAQSLDQLQL